MITADRSKAFPCINNKSLKRYPLLSALKIRLFRVEGFISVLSVNIYQLIVPPTFIPFSFFSRTPGRSS